MSVLVAKGEMMVKRTNLSAVPLAVCAAAALWAPAGAAGAGATFEAVYCDPQNRGLGEAEVREPRGYQVSRGCDNASYENALQINSRLSKADRGAEGRVYWRAPSDSALVGVVVEGKLRRDAGHKSRLYLADDLGRETKRVATGDGTASPFKRFTWSGAQQQMFVTSLRCEDGPSCPESGQAKTWIRELRLRVADYADPGAAIAGTLVAGGWRRGTHELTFNGTDRGSGVRRVYATVNGTELAGVNGSCSGVLGTELASRMQPCSGAPVGGSAAASTAALPFHDGANTVAACTLDFAGNKTCAERTVQVDNRAPTLAFTNAQDPDDPELIQAIVSDAHSGIASGQILYRRAGQALWQPLETTIAGGALRARVDSVSVPEGTYQFKAVAHDRAGNVTETTRRLDGLEKQLVFPLKAGVKLSAQLEPGGSKQLTVRYGKRTRAAGTLRAASGEPLGGQEVTIVENFGDGALIRERISKATSDSRGRWLEKLPAGPSRSVSVFYAGTPRYLAAETAAGRLSVRSKATLRASRAKVPEGKRVVFRGRLGRLGARIPRGGKLLELQVKEDNKTFQTVGQSFRSRSNGSYRMGYRFGDFYEYDVRFKFRVRVARERDWPYKAPIRSKPEKVTVLNR